MFLLGECQLPFDNLLYLGGILSAICLLTVGRQVTHKSVEEICFS